ncbi:MAG: lysophospholipid acyltransferase family protein [Candidatus Poribacteria bacterium]
MKNLIIYVFIASIGFIIRRLPLRLALFGGAGLGDLMWYLLRSRRKIAISNLRLAFGDEKPESELQRIARRSFRNLGKNIAEFLRFPLLNEQNLWDLVTVEGQENVEHALKLGPGVIVFIAHLGNWELLAPVYSALFPKTAAIAFPLKNHYLESMVNNYRCRLGLEIIHKRRATKYVLKALKDNYIVGFIADQNAGREGVFVEFFGKLASTARGPVAIALKTGAPLLLSFDIRLPDDQHRLIITEPMKLTVTGNLDDDVAYNTARLMAELEKQIRRYPCQWMWQHDRWKTRPDTKWLNKRGRRNI